MNGSLNQMWIWKFSSVKSILIFKGVFISLQWELKTYGIVSSLLDLNFDWK